VVGPRQRPGGALSGARRRRRGQAPRGGEHQFAARAAPGSLRALLESETWLEAAQSYHPRVCATFRDAKFWHRAGIRTVSIIY